MEKRKERGGKDSVSTPVAKKGEEAPKKKGPRSPPPWLQKQREKAEIIAEAEAKEKKTEVSPNPARPAVDPVCRN